MSVELKSKTVESKRFVIRKSLLGKNVVITFTNKTSNRNE